MQIGTKRQADSGVVPLQGAVLCVNCECLSNGRFDECPVCGSHSLLSIAHMLGGTPLPDKARCITEDKVLFDLNITIELKQMESADVNASLERITRLIGARLAQGRACFHINVEPVVSNWDIGVKAA